MDVEAVRQKVEPKLLQFKGIVGVSHANPERKIIIYVESERDIRRIPKMIAGIPVEPVVAGKVQALPLLEQSYTQKVRPLLGGVSLGPPIEIAGTLGMVIDGKILTNAHVIALDFMNVDWFPIGTPVYQPSLLDGGTQDDVVGHLTTHSDIKFNVPHYNTVDVAIAEPIVNFREMEIIQIGKVNGIAKAAVGMNVKKVGRTTGLTQSKIFDTNATIKVSYGPFGYAIFKNCIVTKPAMASGGDSGSILLCEANKAVGLIFAGSSYITVANHIDKALEAVKIEPEKMAIPILVMAGAFVAGAVAGYFLRGE